MPIYCLDRLHRVCSWKARVSFCAHAYECMLTWRCYVFKLQFMNTAAHWHLSNVFYLHLSLAQSQRQRRDVLSNPARQKDRLQRDPQALQASTH